jgi:hypothetical protein
MCFAALVRKINFSLKVALIEFAFAAMRNEVLPMVRSFSQMFIFSFFSPFDIRRFNCSRESHLPLGMEWLF